MNDLEVAGGKGVEVPREGFLITFEDADSGMKAQVDFAKVDWDAFASRLRNSFNTAQWEENILQSATKQKWQTEEQHSKEFLDWFSQRMDMLMADLTNKETGVMAMTDEFIDKSMQPGMQYQLAFLYRRAGELFNDEQRERIRSKIAEALSSNDTLRVLEVLAQFGASPELLPPAGSTVISSNNFLVKEALRGLPQKKEDKKINLEDPATKAAYDLVRKAMTERFRPLIQNIKAIQK